MQLFVVVESPPPGYMSEDGDSQAVGMWLWMYLMHVNIVLTFSYMQQSPSSIKYDTLSFWIYDRCKCFRYVFRVEVIVRCWNWLFVSLQVCACSCTALTKLFCLQVLLPVKLVKQLLRSLMVSCSMYCLRETWKQNVTLWTFVGCITHVCQLHVGDTVQTVIWQYWVAISARLCLAVLL